MNPPENVMIFRLVLAAVLGSMVGWERERHNRPAGLRTHALVCLGSALITLVSQSFSAPGQDPSRISAQIVSGIGFLGAGTILRVRDSNIIRGLTTAASLWTVCA
jgi:putative Mg2+ transporter-C (MgtC) family protein